MVLFMNSQYYMTLVPIICRLLTVEFTIVAIAKETIAINVSIFSEKKTSKI